MKKTLLMCLFQAFVLIAAFPAPLMSQERVQNDSLITITGSVHDASRPLPYVNIGIKGTTLGTVTNEDGFFSLKIPASATEVTILVSHLGYYSTSATLLSSLAKNVRFVLNPYPNLLDYASVVGYDPETLVREALQKIRANYPGREIMQRGFYRETARKGSRYISVSEAVVDLYKTSYAYSVDFDKVRVLKGRRLASVRARDTLSVKLQGGPNIALNMDVVKNRGDLFFESDLSSYNYAFENGVMISDMPHYVVTMTPRIRNSRYPLYNAKLYIDKTSLAIMRAEYSVDMADEQMVAGILLKKKPAGVRFKPLDVSFVVSYKYHGDAAYLSYVRGTMSFKCDWKKKLFSSTYTVTSEMVATELASDEIVKITGRESFLKSYIFYDRVQDFADPDFWEDYNILEPSESLENAVGRLRRINKRAM